MKEPKIRFNGFEGEWETNKLNLLVNRVTRKNSKLESKLPLTISATNGLVSQLEYFNNIVAGSNITNYYLIKRGEFAYNKSYSNGYPYGSIKRLDAYEMGILSTLYIVFSINKQNILINSDYLVTFFDASHWHHDVAQRAEEGARNHGLLNINANDFFDINITFPAIVEQQKIATYFQSLDAWIQATEKKLASLRQIKEASLQAMFPQEGETTPKVRFKGFEGEWVISPLKKFAHKVTEKNIRRLYNETFTNSAEFGVISQRDYFDHDISNTDNTNNYYVIHPNDFVYNPRISVTAPVGPISRNLLNRTGVMSPLYFIFHVENINKDFLSYYFKTKLWHRYMLLNGNTGARFDRLSITDEKFLEMPISICENNAEQQKIASYFCNLDKLITLQTQRLEKLKQIKAACLDKMFV